MDAGADHPGGKRRQIYEAPNSVYVARLYRRCEHSFPALVKAGLVDEKCTIFDWVANEARCLPHSRSHFQ